MKTTIKPIRRWTEGFVSILLAGLGIAPLSATERYIAAVGSASGTPMLKVACLRNLDTAPSSVATEVSLASTFSNVKDLTFLPGFAGDRRRIAVLGDCQDWVLDEFTSGADPGGWTHELRGRSPSMKRSSPEMF